MLALQSLGVERIFAIAATGGIQSNLVPKTIVIPHQLIDYTYGREQTYFDGSKNAVHHIDFTKPYSESLRQKLIRGAQSGNIEVITQGVYAVRKGLVWKPQLKLIDMNATEPPSLV